MARFPKSIKGVWIILKYLPGFILRHTPYRNHDAILQILTPEGFLTIQARGSLKVTSPFQAVTSLGSWALIGIKGHQKKFYLETASLIQFPPLPEKEGLLASVMTQVSLQILLLDESNHEGEKLYTLYESFRKHWQDPIWNWLHFMKNYMEIQGIPMKIDACVACHAKTNIVAVSSSLGGFMCQQCFHEEKAKLYSAETLQTLRFFYLFPDKMQGSSIKLKPLIPILHSHFLFHMDSQIQGFKSIEELL